jgi:hypothetical protein
MHAGVTDELPAFELGLTPHGVVTARADSDAPPWARAMAARSG